MIGWYAEISESRHAEGYNIIKMFRNVKQTRLNEVHFVYPKFGEGNRSRMTRVIVKSPPPFIAELRHSPGTKNPGTPGG